MDDELPRWTIKSLYDSGDTYQQMTEAFRVKHKLGEDDIEAQWQVVEEEIEELQEAFEEVQPWLDGPITGANQRHRIKQGLGEEMADVVYTIHLAARMLGIDLREEFVDKAAYNLKKSTERDETGEVTDDA